jgi:hypothetical protein
MTTMTRFALFSMSLACWLGLFPAWSQDVAETPPDLSGTFHLRMDSETHAKIPVLGVAVITTSTNVLAKIDQGPEGWRQEHTTCAVNTLTTRAIAKTVLPPPFIRAMGTKRYPLELKPNAKGWHYTAHFEPQHIGYDAVAADHVMPEHKAHRSIMDWDQDGHPGATVLLKIPVFGDVGIYMVQYNHSRLDGQIESANRVTGHMTMLGMNQHTIGASNRLFIANPHIESAPDPKPFVMVRIPEGSTCADVKRLAREGRR